MTPLIPYTEESLARIAADKGSPSLKDACAVIDALRSGDLHYIDSDFIRCLGEMADTGSADFAGCRIARAQDGWTITKDGRQRHADDAVDALLEARRSLNPCRFQYWPEAA